MKKRRNKFRQPGVSLKEEIFKRSNGNRLPVFDEEQKLLEKIEAHSEHDGDAISKLLDPDFQHAV